MYKSKFFNKQMTYAHAAYGKFDKQTWDECTYKRRTDHGYTTTLTQPAATTGTHHQ